MEKYVDYEMCKKCGGQCCKETGCAYLPQDFKRLDFKYLKDQIDKGYISISGQPFNGFYEDAWTFMLYLRARNRNADIVDLITLGGECKQLTDKGCRLNVNQRPSLGVLVKPTQIGGPCKKMYDSTMALDWLKYNEVLSSLVKYYTNKEAIDVVIEQITLHMGTVKEKINALEELKAIEKQVVSWYYDVMANKPYYTPEEVKSMILF